MLTFPRRTPGGWALYVTVSDADFDGRKVAEFTGPLALPRAWWYWLTHRGGV